MQRLGDELLGDVRAVAVGGVDEVDPELERALAAPRSRASWSRGGPQMPSPVIRIARVADFCEPPQRQRKIVPASPPGTVSPVASLTHATPPMTFSGPFSMMSTFTSDKVRSPQRRAGSGRAPTG